MWGLRAAVLSIQELFVKGKCSLLCAPPCPFKTHTHKNLLKEKYSPFDY